MDGSAPLVLCYVLTFLGSLGFPSHSLSITNDGESVSIICELKWYTFCSYPSKVRLPLYGRPRAKAFFGRRVLYCNNCTATTNLNFSSFQGTSVVTQDQKKGTLLITRNLFAVVVQRPFEETKMESVVRVCVERRFM